MLHAAPAAGRGAPRRGLILPVILFILVMVGLLGAMFAFRVHADSAALKAYTLRLQTRMAAEAGVERVKLMLRDARFDQSRWYNNPDELHRIIVWGHDLDPLTWGTNEEFDEGDMIYRFSVVADDPADDEDFVRFGITDEASKLDLNLATRDQLLHLMRVAVGDDLEIIPEDIVDAIIDWRDPDSVPSGEETDTEGEHYLSLDRPYLIKNGPFDTVEELLLVKGVTGQILYGEDQDRNGLLTDNEDDGDVTFPPDNQDNVLNRGLFPYLTVVSYETNIDNANRQRVYLFADAEILREALEEAFEGEPDVIDFIVNATRQGTPNAGPGGGAPGGNTGNDGGDPNATQPPGGGTGASRNPPDNPGTGPGPDQPFEKPPPEKGAQDPPDDANAGSGDPSGGQPSDGRAPEGGNQPPGGETNPPDGGTNPQGGGDSDGANDNNRPIRSPASLMLDRTVDGQVTPSPLTFDHLPILMDRFTTYAPDVRKIRGLINVNTASRLVLDSLEDLTAEQVDAIVEIRRTLGPDSRRTTAWLVTTGAIDLETYERIAPSITARGQQFTIEVLGYADHVGMVTRLQVVVDMVGPIAHTMYYRDISEFGAGYPIREKDLERVVGR